MKIILSRKGFDSKYGGCASPILPDGTMLSLPIPGEREADAFQVEYADLLNESVGLSYDEIWSALGKKKYRCGQVCHLDPDIRKIHRKREVEGWTPAFGQCEGAQTHLENQGVGLGDLFLFFGWFRPAERGTKAPIQYIKKSQSVHALYGYLQVGEIVKGEDIRKSLGWHPHAAQSHCQSKGNTLYLPTKELSLPGIPDGLPGYGVFCYGQDLVLTAPGMSRSKWHMLDWMKSATISHHSAESLHADYFQSAAIGQEFVISECPEAVTWASEIFSNHAKELVQ